MERLLNCISHGFIFSLSLLFSLSFALSLFLSTPHSFSVAAQDRGKMKSLLSLRSACQGCMGLAAAGDSGGGGGGGGVAAEIPFRARPPLRRRVVSIWGRRSVMPPAPPHSKAHYLQPAPLNCCMSKGITLCRGRSMTLDGSHFERSHLRIGMAHAHI